MHEINYSKVLTKFYRQISKEGSSLYCLTISLAGYPDYITLTNYLDRCALGKIQRYVV